MAPPRIAPPLHDVATLFFEGTSTVRELRAVTASTHAYRLGLAEQAKRESRARHHP